MYLYYITGLQTVNHGLPAHNDFFFFFYNSNRGSFVGEKSSCPYLKIYLIGIQHGVFAVLEISVPHGFLIIASSISVFHCTSQCFYH